MPLAGFICPDGQKVNKELCLQGCRLQESLPAGRCKAVPFLRRAARDKTFEGLPSTTQLLAGTRETLLKITRDYYIDPDRKTAAIIGTGVHSALWRLLESEKGEETLISELLHGTYDLYDPHTKTLYDYKTWGVWKLAKIIHGTAEQKADALFEVTLQMHQYRLLLTKKYPSIQIENVAVQVISRDANTRQAESRGIQQMSPLILLPDMPDSLINEYFEYKAEKLQLALKQDWAPPCTDRETWEGRKCNRYCDVKELCYRMPAFNEDPAWQRLQHLGLEIENKVMQKLIGHCRAVQQPDDLAF